MGAWAVVGEWARLIKLNQVYQVASAAPSTVEA